MIIWWCSGWCPSYRSRHGHSTKKLRLHPTSGPPLTKVHTPWRVKYLNPGVSQLIEATGYFPPQICERTKLWFLDLHPLLTNPTILKKDPRKLWAPRRTTQQLWPEVAPLSAILILLAFPELRNTGEKNKDLLFSATFGFSVLPD